MAPNKGLFSTKSTDIYFIFPQKKKRGTLKKHLWKVLLMSTHNIFFVEK